ncbi:M20 family metallopeptidase [Dethiosulfatarculus sandiegensis]|uniref:M20 family metallopeptidase n=1 Tax=Dethiosulfatarculus sandiegensis TaxID=1429043 RepID=UPI0005C91380|nr:M20 family metallopeptidase [Dethiosulfatarculus sandiegensis]
MSREKAILNAQAFFDSGEFFELLAKRVALPTESQNPAREKEIRSYLEDEMIPNLKRLGFECRILDNPVLPRLPMLAAQRMEDPGLDTILTYGHGDVVRGLDDQWEEGLSPWRLTKRGDRWYGRGAVDNKGQHALNFTALEAVLKARGRLGFNLKVLIDMGEEMGSPGLYAVCEKEKNYLAADVLIGSDGPRLKPEQPMLCGGTRGLLNFDLIVDLREGGHHSGNWGGLLANPGTILANAVSCLIDKNGVIQVPEMRPDSISPRDREVLAEVKDLGVDGPAQDPSWGEPGLTQAEKVFAFNALEVLAFETGNPARPVHAIPPKAFARLQIRFVKGKRPEEFIPAVRRRLDKNGFERVLVKPTSDDTLTASHGQGICQATRLDPDNPWARLTMASVRKTTGKNPVFLPNVGGSLPNDVFTDTLGMPTVWIPHSYPGCSQHAPNEHLLASVYREALGIMAGLFWDLGESQA